jgi:BolA protein
MTRAAAERGAWIEARLREALAPEYLVVVDESDRHRGHAGHRPEGGTHFRVTLVSPRFEGCSRVERHRLVYGALGAVVGGEIHALALELFAPSERR